MRQIFPSQCYHFHNQNCQIVSCLFVKRKKKILYCGLWYAERKKDFVHDHKFKVFACALADVIQHMHKDCKKKKHAVDSAIILFIIE